jgi:hypothetical protein
MVILQVEHKIKSFETWKKAFDSDPINRKQAGVCRYSVLKPANDPNYIIIDLEFNKLEEAENALAKLRILWGNVDGKIMMDPQTRILDLVERTEI